MNVSQNKKIRLPAKASLFYLLAIIGSRAIGILTTPLFTRAMSPEEYGSYSYYISVLSISSMLSGVFLTPAVFYSGLGKFSENRKEFANTGIILSSAVNLLICIVLFAFSGFFGITKQIAIIIFLQGFVDSIVTAELLRSKFSYGYPRVIAINLSSAILGALISLCLVFSFDLGAMGRILGLLISGAIIASVLLLRKGERPEISLDGGRFLLKNAPPLIPAVIARASVGFLDKLIIKSNLGASALAKYSVAHTVGTALLALIGALSSALNPWIIRKLRQGEENTVFSVVDELSAIISWGSVTILALAPEIFSFLAPKSYGDALYVIAPLAVSATPYFLFSILSVLAGFRERTRLISASTLAGAAVSIGLNLILIPRIGILGGGIAYLAAETVMYLSSFIILREHGRESSMLGIKPEVFISLGIGGLLILLYGRLPLRIFLLIIPAVMAVKHGFTCLDLAKEK